jgi:DNA-binding CsgD family transcriptional regulator
MEDSSPDRSSLTPREREVLALIGRGKSTKQIALTLGIALSTVTSHREHIKNKLGARSVADLRRAAIRLGLINP